MRRIAFVVSLAACGDDGRSTIEWTDCGAQQCATLEVPIDDATPSTVVELALTRRVAEEPSRRIGSLLINFGGPGVDSSDAFLAEYTALLMLGPELTDRFDIVGVDLRGVGASEGIACVDDATLDALWALDFTPDSAGETQALDTALAGFRAGCQANVRPELLASVDSAHAARDLDRVRAALGEDTISFYGQSYGSRLGAVYASQFPDRVRAFVLDGVFKQYADRVEFARSEAMAYERALGRFFDWCGANTTCALHETTASAISARFDSVFAALEAAPLSGGSRTLSVTLAYNAVQAALRAATFPALATALAAAEDGDATPLLDMSNNLTGRNATGQYAQFMHIQSWAAVGCLDVPYPEGFTTAQQDALTTELAVMYPRLGAYFAQLARVCHGWPVRLAEPLPFSAPTAPPLLLFTGRYDPGTPYENAQPLLDVLGNDSYLVTYEGDGHPPASRTACGRTAVREFLLDPSAAPAQPSCPVE